MLNDTLTEPSQGSKTIPKILHALWLQGRENAPPYVQANLDRWERLNPDYELRVIDRQGVRDLLAHTGIDTDWFQPSALANIARLQLLYNHGGVWTDATLLPTRPLSDWLDDIEKPDGFFAFSNPAPDRVLSVWFLVSTKANPVIGTWLEGLLRYWEEDHAPFPTYVIPDDPVASVMPGKGRKDRKYPYFAFAYTFAYLLTVDPEFRAMWERCPDVPAIPCHALLNLHKSGVKISPAQVEECLQGAPVLKLNWRHSYHPAVLRRILDDHANERGFVEKAVHRILDETSWMASSIKGLAQSKKR
ncbi:MAG: capsular polysaccharide synthesis protein [Pseudomonadota bacterium]